MFKLIIPKVLLPIINKILEKYHHSKYSPLLLLPWLLLLSMTLGAVGHPFGQVETAVLAVPPPNLLCTPSTITDTEQ